VAQALRFAAERISGVQIGVVVDLDKGFEADAETFAVIEDTAVVIGNAPRSGIEVKVLVESAGLLKAAEFGKAPTPSTRRQTDGSDPPHLPTQQIYRSLEAPAAVSVPRSSNAATFVSSVASAQVGGSSSFKPNGQTAVSPIREPRGFSIRHFARKCYDAQLCRA
jgi:hypothetical protein